jgi:hypothetical protein
MQESPEGHVLEVFVESQVTAQEQFCPQGLSALPHLLGSMTPAHWAGQHKLFARESSKHPPLCGPQMRPLPQSVSVPH